MATDPTIALKIRTALGEYLKRDPAMILITQHLRDDLGLDSMAVIELLYRIEETFDLQIPDQDLAGMTTVGHVVNYVEKRLGKRLPPPRPRNQRNLEAKEQKEILIHMAMRARIPISLAQIHKVVGGELVGSPQATVTSLAGFEEAGPNDLTFVTGDRLLKTGGPTVAGALLAHRRLAEMPIPTSSSPIPHWPLHRSHRLSFAPSPLPEELVRRCPWH